MESTTYNGVTPPPERVRVHLEAMLESEVFARSDRLGRFLRYVVEESLAGRGDGLKEYAIGVAVYDRPDFDPRLDSAVRVDARRPRRKLEEFYAGPGADSPVRIDVPKGGYVAVFREAGAAESPMEPVPVRKRISARWAQAALASVVVLVAGYIAVWTAKDGRVKVLAVAPFTNLTGEARMDAMCAGLEEEVRHRAARMGGLRVLAGGQSDVWKAAKGLGVEALISGSVRASGDRLRVSAQLVRVSDRGLNGRK